MTDTLRLVQYWDTGAPPAEVTALMTTWAVDPAYRYHAYSRDQAIASLAAHFPERVLRAFRKCRYPAMQADLYRYCTLLAEGGIYVDADTGNGGGMDGLIGGCGRGCLMFRKSNVANDFMYFANSGDPLLQRVVDLAVTNVENEVSNNVWQVTGPGIMTALHANPANAPLFDGLRMLPVETVRKVVLFRWDLTYKQSEDDWRDALSSKVKSIFN